MGLPVRYSRSAFPHSIHRSHLKFHFISKHFQSFGIICYSASLEDNTETTILRSRRPFYHRPLAKLIPFSHQVPRHQRHCCPKYTGDVHCRSHASIRRPSKDSRYVAYFEFEHSALYLLYRGSWVIVDLNGVERNFRITAHGSPHPHILCQIPRAPHHPACAYVLATGNVFAAQTEFPSHEPRPGAEMFPQTRMESTWKCTITMRGTLADRRNWSEIVETAAAFDVMCARKGRQGA